MVGCKDGYCMSGMGSLAETNNNRLAQHVLSRLYYGARVFDFESAI